MKEVKFPLWQQINSIISTLTFPFLPSPPPKKTTALLSSKDPFLLWIREVHFSAAESWCVALVSSQYVLSLLCFRFQALLPFILATQSQTLPILGPPLNTSCRGTLEPCKRDKGWVKREPQALWVLVAWRRTKEGEGKSIIGEPMFQVRLLLQF